MATSRSGEVRMQGEAVIQERLRLYEYARVHVLVFVRVCV